MLLQRRAVGCRAAPRLSLHARQSQSILHTSRPRFFASPMSDARLQGEGGSRGCACWAMEGRRMEQCPAGTAAIVYALLMQQASAVGVHHGECMHRWHARLQGQQLSCHAHHHAAPGAGPATAREQRNQPPSAAQPTADSHDATQSPPAAGQPAPHSHDVVHALALSVPLVRHRQHVVAEVRALRHPRVADGHFERGLQV